MEVQRVFSVINALWTNKKNWFEVETDRGILLTKTVFQESFLHRLPRFHLAEHSLGTSIRQTAVLWQVQKVVVSLRIHHSIAVLIINMCTYTCILYNGYWVSFLGVKWLGHGIVHPPPCSPLGLYGLF